MQLQPELQPRKDHDAQANSECAGQKRIIESSEVFTFGFDLRGCGPVSGLPTG
jgi:hypothetical protein